MNIAYFWQREDTDLDQVSGPVLHVRAVIEGLRQHGHGVRLVTYKDGQPAWSDDLVTWHRVPLRVSTGRGFRLFESSVRGVQSRLQLPFAGLFDSLHFAEAFLLALKDIDLIYERFDLLGSAGVIAGRKLRVPAVLELNGDLVEEWKEQGLVVSRSQWSLIRQVTRWAFGAAAHLVTVTEGLRQSTIEQWGIDPPKVTTVTNGVNLDVFTGAQASSQLNPEGDSGGHPTVIHVGSFQPWHSLDLLVEAFGRLDPGLRARLVLVGDGPLRAEIEDQVDRLALGRSVTFTGSVSHPAVAQLLDRADVAVLAHRPTTAASSGTPLKLMEYMAAGKAIVAPKLGNIVGVVNDQETALLFEPGSVESLRAALANALTNDSLRQALGCAAREAAIAHHSWDRTVAELEGIFIRLLEAR